MKLHPSDYRDYRNAPCMNDVRQPHTCYKPANGCYNSTGYCAETKYTVNLQWYHVWMARLAFILVFEVGLIEEIGLLYFEVNESGFNMQMLRFKMGLIYGEV